MPDTIKETHYKVDNDEVLTLIKNWVETGKKVSQQKIIIDKLSYLIYTKCRSYRKECFHEDLIQEGKVALITALNDFDQERGINFFKVASWHLSNRFRAFIKKVKNKEVSCENVEQFIKDTYPSPLDYYEKLEEELFLKKLLFSLSDIEKYIVTMRFGIFGEEKLTLEQIGKKLAISKQYVEQLEKQAIGKLTKKTKENSCKN
jgi:RNA polymerase sigma factor (sigma-70 family)